MKDFQFQTGLWFYKMTIGQAGKKKKSIVLISSFKLPSWKYPVEWVLVWVTIMLFS